MYLLQSILGKLLPLIVRDLSSQPVLDLINFLLSMGQAQFNDAEISGQLAGELIRQKEELTVEGYSRVIKAFSQMGQLQFVEQFVNLFLEEFHTKGNEGQVSEVANILFSYAELGNTKKESVQGLVKVLLETELKKINISDYVSLWLGLAQLRVDVEQNEILFRQLKLVPERSENWKLEELEIFEVINLIVSCALLRVNDKEFIGKFVGYLNVKFSQIDPAGALNLARSFIIYVRQFEDFYIKIHNLCAKYHSQYAADEK